MASPTMRTSTLPIPNVVDGALLLVLPIAFPSGHDGTHGIYVAKCMGGITEWSKPFLLLESIQHHGRTAHLPCAGARWHGGVVTIPVHRFMRDRMSSAQDQASPKQQLEWHTYSVQLPAEPEEDLQAEAAPSRSARGGPPPDDLRTALPSPGPLAETEEDPQAEAEEASASTPGEYHKTLEIVDVAEGIMEIHAAAHAPDDSDAWSIIRKEGWSRVVLTMARHEGDMAHMLCFNEALKEWQQLVDEVCRWTPREWRHPGHRKVLDIFSGFLLKLFESSYNKSPGTLAEAARIAERIQNVAVWSELPFSISPKYNWRNCNMTGQLKYSVMKQIGEERYHIPSKKQAKARFVARGVLAATGVPPQTGQHIGGAQPVCSRRRRHRRASTSTAQGAVRPGPRAPGPGRKRPRAG